MALPHHTERYTIDFCLTCLKQKRRLGNLLTSNFLIGLLWNKVNYFHMGYITGNYWQKKKTERIKKFA